MNKYLFTLIDCLERSDGVVIKDKFKLLYSLTEVVKLIEADIEPEVCRRVDGYKTSLTENALYNAKHEGAREMKEEIQLLIEEL